MSNCPFFEKSKVCKFFIKQVFVIKPKEKKFGQFLCKNYHVIFTNCLTHTQTYHQKTHQ
ncbi:hypothetical protein AO369_0975 [Moraxella catarrhalis]|nr:hypothetical protein AO369_0975 [Moraxella catarrhalis]